MQSLSRHRVPFLLRAARLLAGLLAYGLPVEAQYPAWSALYDSGPMVSQACPGDCDSTFAKGSLVVDGHGGFYVTGRSFNGLDQDIRTSRYAPDGTLLWTVAYDGPFGGDDKAYAVAVDAAGDAYVTGASRAASGGGWGFRTIKYSAADGRLLWSASFNGVAGDSLAYAIAVDASGHAWVTGASMSNQRWSWRTIRYSGATGQALWNLTYQAAANRDSEAWAIALDGAGNAYVTGYGDGGSGTDMHTIKYAPNGTTLWAATWDGPSQGPDKARALAVDAADNVYVVGEATTPSGGIGFRTIKYAAANGSVLWSRAWDAAGNNSDYAYAVALNAAGDAYVTGSSYNGASLDFRTVKYAAADGAERWSVGYDGDDHGDDLALAIAVDAAGDAYVAGGVRSGPNKDAHIFKYASADGSALWSHTHAGAGGGFDRAYSVALDSAGQALVTAVSSETHGTDFRTSRHASSDGAVLFAVPSGATVGGDDRPLDSAVDAGGNVYVTGVTFRGPAGRAFRTIKYAPNGSVVWSVSTTASAQPDDTAVAIALDAAGNAYVTGAAWNGANIDIRTVKYSGADGSLLWSATFDGPAHLDDRPSDVAVDPSGHVCVTGYSKSGPDWDFRTLRYAPDGSLLWSVGFDGSAQGNDVPFALAVDGSGNVYVTGYSTEGSPGASTYRTLKLAAADGSVLWSASGGNGFGRAVALDGAGNAIVTGGSTFRVIKYSGGDGSIAWSSSDSGGGNLFSASALAVDAAGDAYVVGHAGAGGSAQYRVLKYGGVAGARLWQADLGSSQEDVPSAVTVAARLDGDGHLYAAARNGTNGAHDVRTAKYAAADGSLLWSVSFATPGDERYPILAADGQAAYVTAPSFLSTTGYDFLTVKYKTETLPPTNPTMLLSGTHVPGRWSHEPVIGMRWAGAQDERGGSGLDGYSLGFDTSPDTQPDATVDVPHRRDPHTATSPPLVDGQSHYFHLRACDRAGNCAAAAHVGPYWLDLTPPVGPPALASTSHTPGVPSADETIDIVWDPSSDPLANGVAAGLDGYSVAFAADPDLACDGVKEVEEGTTSATSPALPGGNWHAHVCARDNAGNWSSVAHAGPYLIGTPADLALTLADDLDPAPVYGGVTYKATYGNAGPVAAPDARLTLTLSPGLGLVMLEPGAPTCAGSGSVVKCALGDLPIGAGGTVTLVATPLRGSLGTQSVSGLLTAATSDPQLQNNAASEATQVRFVKGDMQGDLATDLLLARTSTGEHAAWLMAGTTLAQERLLVPATPSRPTLALAAVDDFDADQRNDLAWHDAATGQVEFWLMDGLARVGDPVPLSGAAPLPPSWRLSASADFDHDGRPDLVWRDTVTQKLVIWTMNGTHRSGVLIPYPARAVDASWEIAAASDFNADGNADFLWYNQTSGRLVFWFLDAAGQRLFGQFANPPGAAHGNWRMLAAGDYGVGADGIPATVDVVWRNADSGKLVVWFLDSAGNRTAAVYTAPDAPTPPFDWTLVGPR